jgi:hypothetical protein
MADLLAFWQHVGILTQTQGASSGSCTGPQLTISATARSPWRVLHAMGRPEVHEAADPEWRVRRAAERIGIVRAYFNSNAAGTPIRAAGGTFEVHAPSRTTLDALRQMLVQHEGLTIVSEGEAPGLGILIKDFPA